MPVPEGEGASILETDSYIVALVFLVFLALFVSFEKLIEWRQANLTRRRKVGLLAALDAVKTELMLFGVASLLLNVLEKPITSICIHAPSTPRWTILSQLNGCECCLQHTSGISECFLEGEACGTDFCNCNNANPSCLAEANSTEAAGTEAGEATRRLLASPQHQGRHLLQEASDSSEQCVGFSEYSVAECGFRPGYKQALTSLSITQIHTMLFYIAATHILCSVIMHKIGAARIEIWNRWLSDDDAHTTAVKMTLQQLEEAAWKRKHGYKGQDQSEISRASSKPNVWQSLARTFSRSASKTGFTDSARNTSDDPADMLSFEADRASSTGLERVSPEAVAMEDDIMQSQSLTYAPDSGTHLQQGSFNSHTEVADGTCAATQQTDAYPGVHGHAPNAADGQPVSQVSTASLNGSANSQHRLHLAKVKPTPGQIHHDVAHMLWHKTAGRAADVKHKVAADLIPRHDRHRQRSVPVMPASEKQVFLADDAADREAAEEMPAIQEVPADQPADTALDIHLPDEVTVEHTKMWHGRKNELDKKRQYSWEWAKCFMRMFRLQTIQHAEISIMRASFILTHRPGKNFKFMDYILASLDDDCAKVVGLGVSVWLVVIIFVLLAGVLGWAAAWFELLAVLLELIINTKLIYIARHTARGGRVHRLKPTIFWFGARGPWVMLLVIKTLLFLVSFIFASLAFFAGQFGPRSCFFTTPGLNAASLPIPWWVVLIVNCIVFLALSFVTLPLYSLGVQMGSDFRPHILTPNVKNRLLDIANANKEKNNSHGWAQSGGAQVRQRKLEESKHGKYRSKYKKLSGGVSAQRWCRKHAPNSA